MHPNDKLERPGIVTNLMAVGEDGIAVPAS
jgi:hypothetical protein